MGYISDRRLLWKNDITRLRTPDPDMNRPEVFSLVADFKPIHDLIPRLFDVIRYENDNSVIQKDWESKDLPSFFIFHWHIGVIKTYPTPSGINPRS